MTATKQEANTTPKTTPKTTVIPNANASFKTETMQFEFEGNEQAKQQAKQISQWLASNPVKGFLAAEEGEALFMAANQVAHLAPCLEIGSYCGLSSVYLGRACQQQQAVLYAVDHHAGSEEHQLGEEYHDADLYDAADQRMNSLPVFTQTLRAAQIEESVIPVIAKSKTVAENWGTPLGLVFIDGGHSPAMSMEDCINWSQFIVPGGILAIHDIFELPEEGGQGPYLGMCKVLESGQFRKIAQVKSLVLLQRI